MEAYLDKKTLNELLEKIDAKLVKEDKARNLIVIGGAVLIEDGMPFRGTEDIDLFGNQESERVWLKEILDGTGVDFDPDDYSDPEKPYVQWVNAQFVNMPTSDEWKIDKEILWKGQKLTLFKPPLGVLLGSKLAAASEKDIQDIQYLVTTHIEWEREVNKYLALFSVEDQEEIENNLTVARLLAGKQEKTNLTRNHP